MKSYRAIGSIFLILVIVLGGLVILKGLNYPIGYRSFGGKTVTVTRSGNDVPSYVSLKVGNGDISVVKNSSISGWYVVVKYDERDKPPEIVFSEGNLSITLGNGIIDLQVSDLDWLDMDVANGNIDVLAINASWTITSEVTNGNYDLKFYDCNITLDISVTNGLIDFSGDYSLPRGSIKLVNGEINFDLLTRYGGEIRFKTDNGDVDVVAENFTIEKTVVNTGVVGRAYRSGDEIDLDLHVGNGSIDLLVVGL